MPVLPKTPVGWLLPLPVARSRILQNAVTLQKVIHNELLPHCDILQQLPARNAHRAHHVTRPASIWPRVGSVPPNVAIVPVLSALIADVPKLAWTGIFTARNGGNHH